MPPLNGLTRRQESIKPAEICCAREQPTTELPTPRAVPERYPSPAQHISSRNMEGDMSRATYRPVDGFPVLLGAVVTPHDYYESYAPTRRHQQTLRLACPPRGARRHRAGSHVHYRSLGGVGAQLFPCGLVVTITRPLATRPRTTRPSRRREPGSRPFLRVPAHRLPGPYPSGLSRGLRLRGFNHWFTRITHCPPCLPRPRDPTVPARRVVVRAACRPSPQLRGQTALSFTGLPRQPGVGVSHPERTGSASWRTNGS